VKLGPSTSRAGGNRRVILPVNLSLLELDLQAEAHELDLSMDTGRSSLTLKLRRNESDVATYRPLTLC